VIRYIINIQILHIAMETKTQLSDTTSKDAESSKFSNVDTKKLVCIQYPGYIKNVDNMLATIGGEETLSNTYFSNKCRLQMTYRPEDLNAHRVCADLIPCTGLLMKVKRRRRKTKPGGCYNVKNEIPGGCDNVEYEMKQEIVGIIKDRYQFQTLMDYQYLTPEPLWYYFKELHGSELGQQDFPPYFAPHTFGRIDSSGSYNYRPNPLPSRLNGPLISKDMQDKFENNTTEINIAARKKRQTESMAALFDSEDVPKEPSVNAVKIINNLNVGPESAAVDTVRKLFEKRPIWSKLAISCHLNVSLERLKKILQFFAYYWLSGPWRTMWCRMGYDPRKQPEAKIYQMIDFRVRDSKESKRNYALLVPKRSYKNYIPRNLQSRTLPIGSSVLAASDEPSLKEEEDLEPYVFSPDKILPSRNMMYQLCDIRIVAVQELVHANDDREIECNEKEGWFQQGTMNKIRQSMASTVQKFFEREKLKRKGLLDENDIETDISLQSTEIKDTMGMDIDDSAVLQSKVIVDESDFLTLPDGAGSSQNDDFLNIATTSAEGVDDSALSYLQMLQNDNSFNDEGDAAHRGGDEYDEENEDELYYNFD